MLHKNSLAENQGIYSGVVVRVIHFLKELTSLR